MAAEPRYVELDVMVLHCEGCGRLTANEFGLCSYCVADEENDKDWGRHVDGWERA